MSKRPWTPGPWPYDNSRIESLDQLSANMMLANKAPEMAELLIELVRIGDASLDIDVAIIELSELYEKAKELLREVGYDV